MNADRHRYSHPLPPTGTPFRGSGRAQSSEPSVPGRRRAVNPNRVNGIKCPGCGGVVFSEGQQVDRALLCGSLRPCGWAVSGDHYQRLVAWLVPRLTLACSNGHTGALRLVSRHGDSDLLLACCHLDLRLQAGSDGRSPDYVVGLGGDCEAAASLTVSELRPKELDRILALVPDDARGEQREGKGETEASGTTSSGKIPAERLIHRAVASWNNMQHPTGHMDRPGDEQYAEQSRRHNDGRTGFLGPGEKSKHNEAKLAVLKAMVAIQSQGTGILYVDEPSGQGQQEVTEGQIKAALVSSLVDVTGLSRHAVANVLRRCGKAGYVERWGRYSLVEGSAYVWTLLPKGRRWLSMQ